MNKTKIEWCDSTWNPVTGCLHGCEYCYARQITNRFKGYDKITLPDLSVINGQKALEVPAVKNGKPAPYPFGFNPTFHKYLLDKPQSWKKPRTVFVCSMADLFGEWVPDSWIEEVFEACEKAPQHRYLFLTKNPQRLCDLANAGKLPKADNFWYGTSATRKGASFFGGSVRYHTFLSVEPLLEPLDAGIGSFGGVRWIIIGAETGNRAGKVVPQKEWIDNICEAAALTRAAVFMKDSCLPIVGEANMRREFPW